MINKENNTYISTILSQKSIWSVDELVEQFKKLLAPFESMDLNGLTPSNDVTFLKTVVDNLPYKVSNYKYIVDNLYKDNGMSCKELSINVFNAEFGLDLVAFLTNLTNKGYDEDDIKSIRLFFNGKEQLSKALLLVNAIFPELEVQAYDLSIKDIDKECACDSILTVNIFPHTFNLGNKQYQDISKLIIKSHFIYSHSIFYEYIDTGDSYSVPSFDCEYYWDDLTRRVFYKNNPKAYTFSTKKPIGSRDNKAKYCIFSALSFDDLTLKHEYKIVLPGLCPGTPARNLFNEKQNVLFYDHPFEGKNKCEDIDDSVIVAKGYDYNDIHSLLNETPTISYTLKRAIEEFPQYEISRGMENNEEWAFKVYEFYYNEALNGNTTCYNNLGVLNLLSNSCTEDYEDINSELVKTIIGLFELAANGGDKSAMINLASLYMAKGAKEKGIEYYKLASQSGEPCGSYSMGVAYQFGLYGCEKDLDKAISYYQLCIEQYLEEIKTDGSSHAPISKCCLNLIMLMYKQDYPFIDIVKAYNKIEKPTDDLTYAYTVISNNLTNRAKDFFKIMKFNKIEEKEPSYVKFNRICALYNGIKNKNDSISSDKEGALKQLKELAETKCPDWPEWEWYVMPELALWICDADEDDTSYIKYWEDSAKVRPEKECAYRTNIALQEKLSEDETREIWKMYSLGHGCNTCHECTSYDQTLICCPKAQYKWATKYETDANKAQEMLDAAAQQEYVRAMEQLYIHNFHSQMLPGINDDPMEQLLFRFGSVPDSFKTIIDKFAEDEVYGKLTHAADIGSRKSAGLLLLASKLRDNKYDSIYWGGLSSSIMDNIEALELIVDRTIEGDYFYPETMAEHDYINHVNQKAEKFLGEKEEAFEFLKKVAEFYFRGEYYQKALDLYRIAEEKEFDVSSRIKEIEAEIERERREAEEARRYDYDDYYDDYDRYDDGVNWDYYNPNLDMDQQDPEFWG